ncbi:GLPGLI family protein [Hyunsoonleella pacifica]|uniref:GLPGLI family protein n=1 Tax=Hyunsoonleella pacifica TaxID=1080224 RepID=A0A4Q9FLP5_9FLAO|nr:GLPGLI family protein [Hyunsoonleella pacifica]TBN14583.1 GLPGLI family protein [Hyunsoonleella pacifica]GGD15010.1 GLPGLI family protein [Hyunsoonleella pacifica]
MKTFAISILVFCCSLISSVSISAQEFQGRAEYVYKAQMNLGRWGAKMSEAQKKQIAVRLKNRLEKKYILTFNKEASIYDEYEKLDAMSGATDSWGKNFTPGEQYKNVKTKAFIQEQEFYGKTFLVNDTLLEIDWKMETETKQIGNYKCFKATAMIPSSKMAFWEFSWSKLRQEQGETDEENSGKDKEEPMTEVTAWYTPQIPVSQGPSEFWGLPGLILEVSSGSTTMLCSKIVINPKEKAELKVSKRGTEVTKQEYKDIIFKKMKEFRDNRVGRGYSRS